MEDNITRPHRGLHTDNSYLEQPKDTMSFALNAITETKQGDSTFTSNEESNEVCFNLPSGYIPLGQVYIENNETVIFSVSSDETLSEIGIVDGECNYTTLVSADLGFTVANQIDITYRLRRGCERTLYWVDPKIRYYNIDKPEDFKTIGSTEAEINDPTLNWEIDRFFLFNRYSSIPVFDQFTVRELGNLLPGSYNFAVQYLDNNLNPTEFIVSSEVINIYNDNPQKAFNLIRGSSTEVTDYKEFPTTNKSIEIEFDNLDQEFPFYRLAIMEATNASGQISTVRLTAPIPISNNIFSYSGSNFESEFTIEEVQLFNNIITEAEHIEQIENRLILANSKGSQVNYCNLQKYASRITADLVTKDEEIFVLETSAKNPAIRTANNVSYMPGEIYSFGIQYFLEDNTLSPVFHIPGRNSTFISDMSIDNELQNTVYTDNSFCTDYWGVDSEGQSLLGQLVRHHRFPLRSEVDKHFFRDSGGPIILGPRTVPLFGIRFNNIDTPTLEDTNGVAVVGYQIVRQERTLDSTTIIDTAILTPIVEDTDFAGNGNLMARGTDVARVKSDIFGYISMEASFNNNRIAPTEIVLQGYMNRQAIHQRSVITQDVAAGTSYDPEVHRRRDRDSDGFSLHSLTNAYGITDESTGTTTTVYATGPEIKDVFFLNSLESRTITDINGDTRELYNLQADNRGNFIQLDKHLVTDATTSQQQFNERLPVVVLRRALSDPYSNFRLDPYYTETNFTPISNTSISVFNGDTYYNSLVYSSTIHYDVRLAIRATKNGLWNAILGVLAVVAGAVLIATGVGIGLGLLTIGFGLSQVATGVRRENISRVYQDAYEEGLRQTIEKEDTDPVFQYANTDDEIQWYQDVLDGMLMESRVNIGIREGATRGAVTDFIDPGQIERTGVFSLIRQDAPQLFQEYYLINKLTVTDSDTESGRLYRGYPTAEIYQLNPDFTRINNGKIFFHVPLEFDCCSDCIEEFPNRISYSEQSFQEELSDNYRIFLPNNFTDIEGEKGEITDLFRIQNNLYVHTREALWHLPQNIQERVTGDVISFIGTGSFFSIPPRKIVDDAKSSAGCIHKWATQKTAHGVFFVSYIDRKIYQFNGQRLIPISDSGMFNWFRENIPFNGANINGNINNPSNPNGFGFVSVYDSEKERFIISKKDSLNGDNYSWTISYSLKNESWISFHSYLPSFYYYVKNQFFSWIDNQDSLWQHNIRGNYQNFYGTRYPYIIEYVSLSNPLISRIWENITLQSEALEYVQATNSFLDKRFVTFNKGLFYNTRQNSGILNLNVKDTDEDQYLMSQIVNEIGTITIDRNERDWSLNEIRDIVIDNTVPMFEQTISNLQDNYYIDKEVNPNAIDFNKDWTQLESFRDKYLVVRLIFDNFDNIRLISNYSVETEHKSYR